MREVNLTLVEASSLRLSDVRMFGGSIRVLRKIRAGESDRVNFEMVGCSLDSVRIEGISLDQSAYLGVRTALDKCFGYVLVDDDDQTLRSFMQKTSADETVRYVGWDVRARVVFVAAHLVQRLTPVWDDLMRLASETRDVSEVKAWAEESLSAR